MLIAATESCPHDRLQKFNKTGVNAFVRSRGQTEQVFNVAACALLRTVGGQKMCSSLNPLSHNINMNVLSQASINLSWY